MYLNQCDGGYMSPCLLNQGMGMPARLAVAQHSGACGNCGNCGRMSIAWIFATPVPYTHKG